MTWENSGSKAMTVNKLSPVFGYGAVVPADFNSRNTATMQQWLIFSEDELEAYRAAAVSTAINDILAPAADDDQRVFDLQGRQVTNPTKGLYIINGRKVILK